jgi:hypothetical protein
MLGIVIIVESKAIEMAFSSNIKHAGFTSSVVDARDTRKYCKTE